MKVNSLDLIILIQSKKIELTELIAYHDIDSEDICLICSLLFDKGKDIGKEIKEYLLQIKGEILERALIILQKGYELLEISDNENINSMHLLLLAKLHKLNRYTVEGLTYMYHIKPLASIEPCNETVEIFVTKHYSPIDHD